LKHTVITSSSETGIQPVRMVGLKHNPLIDFLHVEDSLSEVAEVEERDVSILFP
jgi:hypothetical protein